MVILGAAVIFIALLIWGIVRAKRRDPNARGSNDWWILVWIASLCLIFELALVSLSNFQNSVDIQKHQAFYDYNTHNYAAAVTGTQAILSEQVFRGSLVAGSLEKTDVGKETAARVREWRDSVVNYNANVAGMRVTRDSWILPGFLWMPEIPATLKPIVIETVSAAGP